MNDRVTRDSITMGIIAVGLILFVLICIVVIIMLSARRQKLKQELLQAQINNKLLEMQFAALRSQMNPHFVFNCLNSIRLFTEKNNGEAASLYLGKFSLLIRHTLNNARVEKITLNDELHALDLYLDLERLRFKQKVNYKIIVNEEVDQEFIEVPPLIIQPLVENAIVHGLLHKTGNGNIEIHISYQNDEQDYLKIVVSDDGIGRHAAAKIKRQVDDDRISFGSQIIQDRLAILHKGKMTSNNFYLIKDLVDNKGHATGTQITIILPT